MTHKKDGSAPVGLAPHGDKKSSVDGAYKMKPSKPEENKSKEGAK